MTTRLRKLRAVPSRDRALLLRAAVVLAITRVAIALVPFRVIAQTLGLRQVGGSPLTDVPCPDVARRVGWAVRTAAANMPWRSTCLTQALAGSMMLTRSGIESTLSFGVAKDGQAPNDLIAHAWLQCGEAVLTGEADDDRFVELVTFARR
jgi:hypothetical protein